MYRKNAATIEMVGDAANIDIVVIGVKGRFLLFQVYRNFANLFSKLFVSTFYKLISKFQQKLQS